MIHRTSIHLSHLVATASLAVVFLFLPTAVAEDRNEAVYEGTEVLRRIFKDQGFTAVRPDEWRDQITKHPEDTIVFFLGFGRTDPAQFVSPDFVRIDELPGGLQPFLQKGGAVLIATSYPPPGAEHEISSLTGLEIRGVPLDYTAMMARDDEKDLHRLCYQDKPHCPFLWPVRELKQPFDRLFLPPGKIGSVMWRIATNEPTYLQPVNGPGHCTALASLIGHPIDLFLDPKSIWSWTFAVGGELDSGRYLILANHRMFLNRMMMPEDTDNVEFTKNCLSILEKRKDGGTRKKLLFVHLGRINANFDVKMKDLNILDKLPELLAAGLIQFGKWLPTLQANLARAEERDAFHLGLWRILEARGIGGADVMRWAFLLASGLFLVYGIYRVAGSGRYRLDAATPLLSRVAAEHVPAGSLLGRRRRAMLDNNNLWEAAPNRRARC